VEREQAKFSKIEEYEKAGELQQSVTSLSILFNMLKRIHHASGLSGTLHLDFGNGKKETFLVRSGRILWDESKGLKTDFSFPPQKWELDEMMLLLDAAEEKNQLFVPEKEK
jgi:hypothetical protein